MQPRGRQAHAVDSAGRAEGLDQPVRLDGQVADNAGCSRVHALLIEAAMFAFARAIPADEFAALAGVEDLIGLIAAEVADRNAIDPVLSRLMFEAMGEAERDPALRERMGTMLAQYRGLMIQAVGDGLLLHALLDPGLDVHAALNALRALLAARPS